MSPAHALCDARPVAACPRDRADEIGTGIARDLAEQVFTLCCARSGVDKAEQDLLFDRAEVLLSDAVRDLACAAGITGAAARRRADMQAADAFTARVVELCAGRHGADLVQ